MFFLCVSDKNEEVKFENKYIEDVNKMILVLLCLKCKV